MDDITVRRSADADIPQLDRLLFQVHRVHSDIRPDLFTAGAKKYTDDELRGIIADERRPIFVAERGGQVVGYAFCVLESYGDGSRVKMDTLYIDDLCVDEDARGTHAGTRLFGYVCDFARGKGCYNVTLNVWAGNDSAEGFYRHLGMKVQKTVMEMIL